MVTKQNARGGKAIRTSPYLLEAVEGEHSNEVDGSPTQMAANARLVRFCEAVEEAREEQARMAKLWFDAVRKAWRDQQAMTAKAPSRKLNLVIAAQVERTMEAVRKTQAADARSS